MDSPARVRAVEQAPLEVIHPFLLALDGVVQRDTAVAGLAGEVCVGVQKGSSVDWWSVTFGKSTTTMFIDERSNTANVTWLLPSSECMALVHGQNFDPGRCYLEGDRRLFERFIRRYLSKLSVLGLRVQNSRAQNAREQNGGLP